MAEVGENHTKLCLPASVSLILIIILILFPFRLYAQKENARKKEKKRIELIHADEYRPDPKQGRNLGIVSGNVAFSHNDVIMTCDSAYFYQNKNQFKAFSRVHIEQGDTIDLYGDYLYYDGATEIAVLEGNVILIDKETHLYTPAVSYDVSNRIARYTDHGKITNGDNTLTSIIGTYYANEKMFHFKDSITIVNPDYTGNADTMDYNTETETVFFTGPSEMEGDSIYIYCEKGWYDTKNDIASLWKKSVIDNRQQLIKGDSLYYEGESGYGEAFRNVSIADTTNNLIVTGGYAWYFKDPEQFLITHKALFIQVSKDDSLFLHSDTISARSIADTAGKSFRLMKAYHGCRIFSKQLQSKCDSLSYSFRDSVIRMYYSPVLWSEENQLTADSVAIFTKNRQANRMELYNTAFVTSQVDSLRFNQIKGRNLKGYFRNNKIYKVEVEGNGESIYYLEDKDKLIGVSHNKSSSIEILVNDGKIAEIIEHMNPEGKLDPPLMNTPDNLRLPGFNWFDPIRPKNVSDIFIK